MSGGKGTTACFRITTSHGTQLACDPVSGALIHAPEGSGKPVIGRSVDGTMVLLARIDGGVLSLRDGGETAPAHTQLVRVAVAGDGGAASIHLPGQRVLTAIPGGGIASNRSDVGGWELFQREAVAATSTAFAPLDAEAAPEFLCQDPACDPAMVAVLVTRAAQDRRSSLMPYIAARTDYADVFPLLRMMLSQGAERFEWDTRTHLREGIARHGWVVGEHSYGAPTIVDGQYGPLSIGRYCSIAGEVRIIVSNHVSNTATTYPFASLGQFWPSAPAHGVDHVGKGVTIGHSVWIGAGTTILPGAEIGDGAVIGAMAVVTGKIPPFAVAAGNPARIVRQRFDDPTVQRILATRWWDWPDHEVDRLIPGLLDGDIEVFLAQAASRRPSAS